MPMRMQNRRYSEDSWHNDVRESGIPFFVVPSHIIKMVDSTKISGSRS